MNLVNFFSICLPYLSTPDKFGNGSSWEQGEDPSMIDSDILRDDQKWSLQIPWKERNGLQSVSDA
jgi:hypothetical protein